MREKLGIWVLLFVMIGMGVGIAGAQDLFYEGPVVVDTVAVSADLIDPAEVRIEYVLVNRGDEEQTVAVAFGSALVPLTEGDLELTNPMVIQPGTPRDYATQPTEIASKVVVAM